MDADRFDALSRVLTTPGSRRTALGALLGTLLGNALPGASRDALVAAGKQNKKEKRKTTRQGQARTKHDRHPGRDSGSTKGRRKHSGKDHEQAPNEELTDEQPDAPTADPTPEPVEKPLAFKRNDRDAGAQSESTTEVSAEAVSAATCLPPGAKPCRQGSDCCSGLCKKKKKKCLPCPSGTTYCAPQQACVNLQIDPNNCGTCGNGCEAGWSCQTGRCVSPPWTNQTTFGHSGTGVDEFDRPHDVAVSGDGLMAWVADTFNHRISVWTRSSIGSTEWTNQAVFGEEGSGDTEFNEPRAVAISGDGLTVWVVDSYNDRISVWTRSDSSSTNWTHQTTFGGYGAGPSQFYDPRGIAVSSDGLTAYVADTNNFRMSVWIRSGPSSTDWANQTTFGIGSVGNASDQFRYPNGIVVSGDGLTAYVTDTGNDRVSVWTRSSASSTDWENKTTFSLNALNRPYDIAVSGDDKTAFVADEGNHRISVWRRSSRTSTDWSNQTNFGGSGSDAGKFSYPRGVFVAGDGKTTWVADALNNRISVWIAT
jgi:DNA-binding beta-propeller fold protein YncE